MIDRLPRIGIQTRVLLFFATGLLLASFPASGEERPSDAAALAGLDSVKTVFLVNRKTAPATAGYLKAIRATHESLAKQGVAPTTVLVFLGKAVQFITTMPPAESATSEEKEALESIASTAGELKKLGVRMEVCSAATKRFGVDNASILTAMDLVGNGFISLIGWQSQGYVPMTF